MKYNKNDKHYKYYVNKRYDFLHFYSNSFDFKQNPSNINKKNL